MASATENTANEKRPLSAGLSGWLSRALQFDEQNAFRSSQEAQVAFEEMLAKERGYVTTPAQLDLFVSRIELALGRPAAQLAPPPVPVAAGPTVVSLPTAMPAPEPVAEPVREPAPAIAAATKPVAVAKPTAVPAAVAKPAPVAPRAAPGGSLVGRAGALGPVGMALAALVLVEAGVIGWMVFGGRAGAAGLQGDVVIQSRPVAARVTIDGEEKGITPLTTSLAPGAHIVEVRVGRSEPRVIPVDVKQGVQNSIYVELQSVATVGGLDVRTEPANAKVSVDGRARGTTPLVLRDLAPGDHEVLLEAGRQKVRQTVRIEPGMTSQLVVPLSGR